MRKQREDLSKFDHINEKIANSSPVGNDMPGLNVGKSR